MQKDTPVHHAQANYNNDFHIPPRLGVAWSPVREKVSQSKTTANKQKLRFRKQQKWCKNIIGSTKVPTKSWRRKSWAESHLKIWISWRKKSSVWKMDSISMLKVILAGKNPLPSYRSVLMVSPFKFDCGFHVMGNGLPRVLSKLLKASIYLHTTACRCLGLGLHINCKECIEY